MYSNIKEQYRDLSLEKKIELFRLYMEQVLDHVSVKQYMSYINKDFNRQIIKQITGLDNIFEVHDVSIAEEVANVCFSTSSDKQIHRKYSAPLKKYVSFLQSMSVGNAEQKPKIIKQKPVYIINKFSITDLVSLISQTGLLYDPILIKRFAFSLMAKRFLILSGLAGSGKTQLALAFAKAMVEEENQMCVVSVGADWTNREPLLGFPNALQEGKYMKPESGVLQLLMEANKNETKPYFLILDEMNMSYVERYFADFLSAMESHQAIPLWEGNINDDTPKEIFLTDNVFIIGTINVDETTYMFSPKVLDRANVIEFKISEDEMFSYLKEMKPVDVKSIAYKAANMGESFVDCAKDKGFAENSEVIQVALNTFFKNLKSVNAEFGYRTATEIYRFIAHASNDDDSENQLSIDQIIDCAIVQKLLPKLHGSRKKLEPVLQALWKECFKDKDQKEVYSISKENVEKAKYPLAADKIQRMYESAYANGFTSFAEA